MFRLTREVRFAVNPADELRQPPARRSNSYGGYPSLSGLSPFLSLQVTLSGQTQPRTGYLLNIKEIDEAVRCRAIGMLADLIHRGRGEFGAVAKLYELLKDAWPGAALYALRLSPSPFLSVTCLASEHPMIRLSQKFEFCASHRLHNPELPEEENRRLFGKCNNPHGHGHNYELQVTLRGTPDANGHLIDVPAFERIVAETVIDRFDHKNLNVELDEFADLIPSVENIAMVIHRLLSPRLKTDRVALASVTVWETPKTWCEYGE